MIYMNSKMRDSFNEVCSHEDLSTELSCILDRGFFEINKCVFLVVYGVMSIVMI